MDQMCPESEAIRPRERKLDYEPPRVERVLDPVQLERESVYAGAASGPGG